MGQQNADLWKMFKNIEKKNNTEVKGKLNKSKFPKEFIEIVKMTQTELKAHLEKELTKYYAEIIVADGFIYAKGSYPVVLTAHMDTVHKEVVKDYYGYTDDKGNEIITSPQGIGGDDRCGIYMILSILKSTDYRPTIIFCEDEEVGGVGSNKFVKGDYILPEVKFFIELDRANGNDLVFYDDENYKFQDWCEDVTGYRTAYGSFSDISHFCPGYGISGVNISCGYHHAHTLEEHVVLEEMLNSIDVTIKLLEAAKEIEKPFRYEGYAYADYYKYNKGYSSYRWDDEYYYNKIKDETEKLMVSMVFYYYEKDDMMEEVVTAESKLSAIGMFLLNHPSISWNDILDYEIM